MTSNQKDYSLFSPSKKLTAMITPVRGMDIEPNLGKFICRYMATLARRQTYNPRTDRGSLINQPEVIIGENKTFSPYVLDGLEERLGGSSEQSPEFYQKLAEEFYSWAENHRESDPSSMVFWFDQFGRMYVDGTKMVQPDT